MGWAKGQPKGEGALEVVRAVEEEALVEAELVEKAVVAL